MNDSLALSTLRESSTSRVSQDIDLYDADWITGSDFVRAHLRHCSKGASCAVQTAQNHILLFNSSGTGPLFQRRQGRVHTGIVQPGSVHLIAAGSTAYLAWDMAHSHLAVEIPQHAVEATAADMHRRHPHEARLPELLLERDGLLEHLCLVLVSEISQPDHPARTFVFDSTIRAMTAHLIRSTDAPCGTLQTEGKAPQGLSTRHLARVLNYIEENLSEPVSLSDLATIANVSRFHFTRLFKRSVGLSPMAYLERSRVHRAQQMIEQGLLSLAEIAVAVGFADQSHFTRRFHLHNGQTPAAFARQRGCRVSPRRRRHFETSGNVGAAVA